MRRLSLLFFALIATTTTACGGGGSIRDAISEALVQSLPLRVEAMTGSIARNGAIDRDYVMHIGDDARDVMWRGVAAYDLPEPRPGYVLETATLLFGAERFDGDVFGRLGNIYVQRTNLGAVLDAGDYGRAATGWIRALDAETADVQHIDIRDMVQDVYDAGGRRLDLRFRTAVSSASANGRVDAATIDYFIVILNWRRL